MSEFLVGGIRDSMEKLEKTVDSSRLTNCR